LIAAHYYVLFSRSFRKRSKNTRYRYFKRSPKQSKENERKQPCLPTPTVTDNPSLQTADVVLIWVVSLLQSRGVKSRAISRSFTLMMQQQAFGWARGTVRVACRFASTTKSGLSWKGARRRCRRSRGLCVVRCSCACRNAFHRSVKDRDHRNINYSTVQ
jgi:hypothetical protein